MPRKPKPPPAPVDIRHTPAQVQLKVNAAPLNTTQTNYAQTPRLQVQTSVPLPVNRTPLQVQLKTSAAPPGVVRTAHLSKTPLQVQLKTSATPPGVVQTASQLPANQSRTPLSASLRVTTIVFTLLDAYLHVPQLQVFDDEFTPFDFYAVTPEIRVA